MQIKYNFTNIRYLKTQIYIYIYHDMNVSNV